MKSIIPLLLAACLVLLTPAGAAPEDHAAAKVSATYIKAVAAQDWDAAFLLLEKDSVAMRRAEMVEAVRASPTIDIERRRLEALGIKSLEELRDMDEKSFYIAERKASHDRLETTPAEVQKKMASLVMNFLAVGEEDDLAHVVVRTSHETPEARVSELLFLSLRKGSDGVYRVAPEVQRPQVEELKD
jgi:hypothetical protein